MYEFEEKYVLFIDVLGWSSAQSEGSAELSKALSVAQALAEAFEEGCKKVEETGHRATPRFELFSDSMIVTIPYIEGEVYWPEEVLFSICKRIATATLPHGFLVRGGITKGSIFHNAERNICFGPALIRAYELESRVAQFPRIVIDPDLVGFLEIHDNILEDDAKKVGLQRAKSTRKMDDGVSFVDYLAPRLLNSGKVSDHEKIAFESSIRFAKKIANNQHSDPSIQQKYQWYRTYTRAVETDFSVKRIR